MIAMQMRGAHAVAAAPPPRRRRSSSSVLCDFERRSGSSDVWFGTDVVRRILLVPCAVARAARPLPARRGARSQAVAALVGRF